MRIYIAKTASRSQCFTCRPSQGAYCITSIHDALEIERNAHAFKLSRAAIPEPVVWSPDGPVRLLGVDPDPLCQ